MYTEDFIANIHGVLYHETLPKGHKKIDVKVFEEKKKTRQTDRQNTTVATLELKLDEENHCIYAKVEDIISSGTSITTHDKQQSELISKFDLREHVQRLHLYPVAEYASKFPDMRLQPTSM